jgi:predicted phage terminase large subunit-like protein
MKNNFSNFIQLSATRRSLARFAQTVIPSYEVSPVHKLILNFVGDVLAGKIKKGAIIAPPRTGKTESCNVLAPAFALGRNPRETIISVSYGSELSEVSGRRVRNILSDPAFSEIFPGCKLSADSAAAYRFTTTVGGEYSATGRGGPITGKGASLLILDDLLKDNSEANSETVCRGTIEWLQHVAFTRLTPDGRALVIGTRWSERDPIGWLLTQPGWKVLHLPAFAEGKADALGREIGEALWPSRYPVEALEAIRADVGNRVFQVLYQGNVAAAQGVVFKRDWFRHYQQPPEKFSRIIQSWDTAFKTGATNDYSVCATFGETQNGFYLLALYRAKVEFPELKRQVAQQADYWRPSEILLEDKASGQSLIQELKLATNYPVIPVKIDKDKETRASAVTGYFESGRVLFPEGAVWLADLEDELASFPSGLHDDCVDAISQALNYLRPTALSYGVLELMKTGWDGFAHTFRPRTDHALQDRSTGTVTTLHATPEPPKQAAERVCECGSSLWQVIAGGQLRCQNCGVQVWPHGAPPIAHFDRKNWRAGSAIGRGSGRLDFWR